MQPGQAGSAAVARWQRSLACPVLYRVFKTIVFSFMKRWKTRFAVVTGAIFLLSASMAWAQADAARAKKIAGCT